MVTEIIQKLNRHFNSAYRESIYQVGYLDLARRTDWLHQVPMASPDGGAASYSLLYLLLSILRDGTATTLLELGAGQSTHLLAQYAEACNHGFTSIEEDQFWLTEVARPSSNVTLVHAPLKPTSAGGKQILWYGCERPSGKFDLILVDGPSAHSRPHRYNRLGILNWLHEILDKEFCIVVDDSSRAGERTLVKLIAASLKNAGVEARQRTMLGATTQTVIATPRFRRNLYI